jgi:hypothetical protein
VPIASVFPSPLKLPPDTVADAPLKLIVGSCFTVTAASAVDVMTTAATSTAPRIEIRRMFDPFNSITETMKRLFKRFLRSE